MKLALPQPPRRVRLRQVPRAWARVLAGVTLLLACAAVCAGMGVKARRETTARRAALARWVAVQGTLSAVHRDSAARMTVDVLYALNGHALSASGVEVRDPDRFYAPGKPMPLSVDPLAPEAPLSPEIAREQGSAVDLRALVFAALALLLVAATVVFGVWAARVELRAFRTGLLVWATPEGEPRFGRIKASYFRQGEPQTIFARVRRGEAPTRNGEKVLAVATPGKTHEAWIVDEALAKSLGWTSD